jgi:pyruvate/2-oxoglutarate dehydrogenase complex dihydrolipoamide acyltransferase (E2) component
MAVLNDLNIPRMGSVENAKLVEWRILEGAAFAAGEILYEVETDKVATEVEAVSAGILVRQLSREGDEHKVGDRVGLWADAGTSEAVIAEALARFDQSPVAPAPAPAAAPVSPPNHNIAPSDEAVAGSQLSPLVRRLAKEHGVDLSSIKGSGPGGRILGDDVLAAAGKSVDTGVGSDMRAVPHSMRRKTIARRMTEAAMVPSLTADMQIDLSALLARRSADKADGGSASIMAYVANAACTLLAGPHNALNGHYTNEALLVSEAVHLGIAVDTPDGLVVPVIRNAHQLGAAALSQRIAEVATRARDNDLSPDELEGGTFTLSNPGALGPTIRAEALLVLPQIALLGLPGIVQAPVVAEQEGRWEVTVRPVMRPSLTFDHRALDGGTVIRFLNDLKSSLEAL